MPKLRTQQKGCKRLMSSSIPAKLIGEGELGGGEAKLLLFTSGIFKFKEDMKNTVTLIIQSQLQKTPEIIL